MCLYIGSDVILANLLSSKTSVSLEDITCYCQRLQETLVSDCSIDNVFININSNEMSYVLTKYSREFRYFQGQYFINEGINLNHFNARYEKNIASKFSEVAQAV